MSKFTRNIMNRVNGEYAKMIYNGIYEITKYNDDLARLKLKTGLCRYFHRPKSNVDLFFQFLVEKYSKNDVLDFGIAKLAKPTENIDIFIYEFIDILSPYLFPSRVFTLPVIEGPYEQFGIRIEQDDVVIDAGANIGMFSAFAASKGAKVYGFEPMTKALHHLERTANLYPNIAVVPLALSDKTEELCFTLPDNDLNRASAVMEVSNANNLSQIFIQSVSLDEWTEQEGLHKVDFIKADIEGSERFLLQGAKRILKEMKPKLSICTYHFKEDPQLLENIILSINPSYKIQHTNFKLFAI
jgi:FkbM family methyltransferase